MSSKEIGIQVMVQWALSTVVPIFKIKDEIRNCSCNSARKHIEHGMKVVERMIEKSLIKYCLS